MIDIFIARKSELEELTKLYETPGFQMLLLYGRRRVGKSTLIRRFAEEKTAILFTAMESSMEKNLELFSKSIYKTLIPNMPLFPPFQSFKDSFVFLSDYARKQRLIVVLDEFQYLAGAYKDILPLLQSCIDSQWQDTQMYLILCGSNINFMEQLAAAFSHPVTGLPPAELYLQPFDYQDSAKFVPDYSTEDQALVYGVTGGMPKYLALFDQQQSVHDNIIRLFFNENGYLYEEPSNLLKSELRDVSTYNAVIEALACGATKSCELVAATHTDTATISYCLKSLMSIGLVRKEHAITDEHNRKKTSYVICDNMFYFWYRFVPNGNESILMGEGAAYFQRMVSPKLAEYMGEIFKQMCRTYLLQASREGRLNFEITRIGRWWGVHPKKKNEEQIDIIGIHTTDKCALIGECCYQDSSIPLETAQNLLEQAELISGYPSRQYVLFAKNFFTDEVIEFAEKNNIEMINLEDIYDDSEMI